jgi:ankyrin repeat protein
MHACRCGQLETVKYLVENGANFHIIDKVVCTQHQVSVLWY